MAAAPSPQLPPAPEAVPAPGTALVTGGSTGIGLELARLLAADGWTVVLVARDPSRLAAAVAGLRDTYSASVLPFAVDLSTPEGTSQLIERIEAAGIRVDMLLNNAGVGLAGPFAELPPGRLQELLQLNVVSLTMLTRQFLPGMIERRAGRILNVASTAAFQPGPYLAAYYASKAYVLSLSEAIAEEVRGTGVTVTTLCPGPTRTRFFERAGMRESLLGRNATMDAARVAQAGYAGMRRGKRVVVPGLGNKVLSVAVRLAPRGIVSRAVAGLNVNRS